MLTHRQRLENCISGGPLDRPPVSLWRHFPVDDQTPDGLTASVVAFQKTYDYDFVKVTPESTYSVKDWGLDDRWDGAAEGTRTYTELPIQSPDDWLKLKPLDPTTGRISDQLKALSAITAALGPDTPVIETVFSPLTQARKMAGEETLAVHMRRYPDAVHAGLKTLTESTVRFLEAIKSTGVAGIFYALQYAQYSLIGPEEYNQFARPYHLQALGPAKEFWLNVLHLHGNDVMFEKATELPVQVINWHDTETDPDLGTAKAHFDGVVCGGLRQWKTMVLGSPADIQREADEAIAATHGERFILGTGCVTPITAPHGNLLAARQSVGA
jgi:uroporphyrinogen decarboxylase